MENPLDTEPPIPPDWTELTVHLASEKFFDLRTAKKVLHHDKKRIDIAIIPPVRTAEGQMFSQRFHADHNYDKWGAVDIIKAVALVAEKMMDPAKTTQPEHVLYGVDYDYVFVRCFKWDEDGVLIVILVERDKAGKMQPFHIRPIEDGQHPHMGWKH